MLPYLAGGTIGTSVARGGVLVPEDGMPILNITAEKVALGPLRRELVPQYSRYMNDFAVTRTYGGWMGPVLEESEDAWYQRMIGAGRSSVPFTVYERATLRPIGFSGLSDIDFMNRRATFGICIGERECWGRGYGTETTRLMLDYGFTCLSLHNIDLTVHAFNERGLRAYRRAGFKEMGRRREAKRIAGHAYDIVYMDCLATEFEGCALEYLVPDSE
jgi:RimJ/RimL family protein N-acetyltransferase